MLDNTTSDNTLILGLLTVGELKFGVMAHALSEVNVLGPIEPALTSARALLGLARVRGALLPVYEPMALCGLPAGSDTPRSGAILSSEDSTIALGIDGVSGLLRCKKEDIQALRRSHGPDVLLGSIACEGSTVHVLDHEALFADASLPKAEIQATRRRMTTAANTDPYLTFDAGNAVYAMSAANIFGTVPRRPLDDERLASGKLLGTITYMNRRIPVVDMPRLTGLGSDRVEAQPEIVVLQMPDSMLLGLAVDRIRRIEYLTARDVTPLSAALRQRLHLVRATICNAQRQIFILDADCLRSEDDLLSASQLSDKVDTEGAGHGRPGTVGTTSSDEVPPEGLADKDLIAERERYILFHAGQDFATPMIRLAGVASPPDLVTYVNHAASGVIGYFFEDGAVVPLVDLPQHLYTGFLSDPSQAKMILLGYPGERVGVLVSRVDGIATSRWRSRPEVHPNGTFQYVKLRHQGTYEVVNRLDLEEVRLNVLRGF